MLYLKIENPGICPVEGFTVLGVSTSRYSSNTGVIGNFGSGNKHSIAVCLRNDILPVVFCSKLKLEFFTKPQMVDDGLEKREFSRICVKYSGKEADGKSKTSTEDLGFVLEYGVQDWNELDMALREFVSNAIDRCIREKNDFKDAKIEVVSEEKVRAKEGFTRVFIPITPAVQTFYNNIGKWFLHFSNPELLTETILPKKNRNLGDTKRAVIYRRGVRVREFESSGVESLFDYNLNNLSMDESRKVDDWKVKHECGKALARADKKFLSILFSNIGRELWEFTFDHFAMQPSWNEEDLSEKEESWKWAFESAKGDKAVLVSQADQAELLKQKGYMPIIVGEQLEKAAKSYGVKTADSILSEEDKEGKEILEATSSALAAVDYVWDNAIKFNMIGTLKKPEVKCFRKMVEKGAMLNGYYKDGVVYINTDLAPEGECERNNLSERLLNVAMEEICHYVTGATDFSRDFQDWIFTFAVRMMKKC